MFNLDISERKRYNRVVLVAFLIGAVIYSLIGLMGTRQKAWAEFEVEPFPWWFPLFSFFGGGWLFGGVAGGAWFSWKIFRLKMTESRIPTILLIVFSPFLLWIALAMAMMPGMIIGIPYAINNVFVIRKYDKHRATGEMSILEMNVYGKNGAFMHQLFKEHIFDEWLFEEYFNQLKILSYKNERKELLKLVIRRNDQIISTINNHFLPDNPLIIKNIPYNISYYTDRIQQENQRLIKIL